MFTSRAIQFICYVIGGCPFFTSICLSQTNMYHHFPNSNATWRIDEYDSSFPNGTAISNYQIYIDGDTIAANGLNYHKLSIEGDFYVNTQFYYSTKLQFGILWQDTISKRIFYRNSSDINCFTCDSLLYDFNMQIGDTLLNNYNFHQSGDTMTIQSIDSVLINGSYRKKFHISYLNFQLTGESIIEGIGSTLGGFYQYEYFEQYHELLCFTQNDTTIYPDTSYQCLRVTASIENYTNNSKLITIYPLPVTNYFKIKSEVKITDIELYNLFGIQIRNFLVNNNYDNNLIINDNIQNGFYFLRIKTNYYTVSKPILINK